MEQEPKPRQAAPSGRSEILRKGFVLAKIIYKEIEATRRFSSHQYERFQEFVRDLIQDFARRPVHPNFLLSETEEEADWVYNDAVNTALLVFWYCHASRMGETETFEFTLGGFLHDLGHTLSDQVILHSRSRLKDDGMLPMRMHSQSGYNLLKSLDGVPDAVLQAVLFHHERFDGEGYPTTLPYDRLPVSLKIVGVADAFEAMVNDRPYRKRLGVAEALRQLLGMSYHNFDYNVVARFIHHLGGALNEGMPFYREKQLARTNVGELVQVVQVADDWLRPTVRLLVNANRHVIASAREVSLKEIKGRHLAQVYTTQESRGILQKLKERAAGEKLI